MNKKTIIGSAIIVGLVAAVGATYATKHTEKLVTIGDHIITKDDYNQMISDLGLQKTEKIDPALLKQIIEQYILSSAAEKTNISTREDVVRKIEFMKNMVLRDAYIFDYLEKNISDDTIKSAYEERRKSFEMPIEYHAAHILVEEEKTAKKIAKEINEKSDFSEFAKKYSIGPTGENGGDLGFFTLDMMVKPFSDAVKILEIGAVSGPVKSNFGWHIIKLIDKKQKEKPSFEALKDSLRAELSQKIIIDHIETLKKDANIQYHIDIDTIEKDTHADHHHK